MEFDRQNKSKVSSSDQFERSTTHRFSLINHEQENWLLILYNDRGSFGRFLSATILLGDWRMDPFGADGNLSFPDEGDHRC